MNKHFDEISVHKISLTDETGATRLTFECVNGNPNITFKDKHGKYRLGVGINGLTQPVITFFSSNQCPVINLYCRDNGDAVFQILTHEGYESIRIDNFQELYPRMVICDSNFRIAFSTNKNDRIGDYISLIPHPSEIPENEREEEDE